MASRWISVGVIAALAQGCFEPGVDAFRGEGGAAFPPRGVIAGTIQYVGAPPACDAEGRVRGRAILTSFLFDEPPVPEGDATGAENILIVPGDELFDPEDCAGAEGTRVPILRSAPFTWPDIPLGRRYQVRGFYDRGGDFVPFFGETNQPTSDDVVGGVFGVDGRFAPIAFDDPGDRPRGQRVDGVTVVLSARQWTERPLFRLGPGWDPLASSATLPRTMDPVAVESELFALSRLRLELLAPEAPDLPDALAALGIALVADNPFRAWVLRQLDLDGNDAPDPHPLLPGVPWATPIIQFERIPEPGEPPMPRVTMLGSPRPSDLARRRSIIQPTLDVVVPPVALVDLVPGVDACRVPYVPPGNLVEAYQGGPRTCQEIPTGRYAVTVLQGIAGGRIDESPAPGTSDVGLDVAGGRLSFQTWTVPNPLGAGPTDPDEQGRDGAPRWSAIESQSLGATFVVSDPTPEDGVGDGTPGCEVAPSASTGRPVPIATLPPPDECCAAVQGWCDQPLCPVVGLSGPDAGELVRSPAAADAPCVPFLPPETCC